MHSRKHAGKSARRLMCGAAVALLIGTSAGAAQAQQQPAPVTAPTFAANGSLTRFLLPYSPVVFDLAVQIGRSFAIITYGTRGYDPVTQTFLVSNLHIQRGPFDFTAERFRIGAASTQLGNFSVDLSRLDLPPDVRKGLAALGQERLSGDAIFSFQGDDARAAYDFSLGLDLPRVGELQLSGAVDGFHVLVPLDDVAAVEDGSMPVSQPPTVAGTLRAFTFTYRDLGLVDAATAIAAQGQGVTADQMRAGLAAMPLMSVGALLDGLPGGASPALRAQAEEWARAAGDFVEKRGALRVSFQPSEPVPLERFATGIVDEALIAALNPTVSSGPDAANPPQPAIDPAQDPIGAAAAAITGLGTLQDREGGAASLISLAAEGNLQAVGALASAFGNEPILDMSPEQSSQLYTFLLVGRATGGSVSDASLAALAAKLPPGAARNAEREAGTYFRERTEAGSNFVAASIDNVAGVPPQALRSLAYDYYEGRRTARDYTEAYALALLASAAGDVPAQTLRDDLARAAAENRLELSMDEARVRAASLWTAYAIPPAQPAPPTVEDVEPAPAPPADGRQPGEGYQPPQQLLPKLNAPKQ